MCSAFDLIDIWRIRNPDVKRFSWRQKNPAIQRRLDYWLITDSHQEEEKKVEIIPAIRSDHSAITLHINGIENTTHGPSFWKFNASLFIYLFIFASRFYLNIARYYNTYITYYYTDIDIKIQKYKAEIKITI